ncbi:hypothetical protein ACGFYQ_22935 [Streptomyces sp. NPDC048258]|uniref:hypothetical protein n=1 Tax=Streptomyces sp. NPDC048258 TaxID=3365527 RepID=UPI00371473AE
MRALVYDTAFRARANRKQAWGFGLIAVASGIWLWLACQVLLPYSVEHGRNDRECASRVFYESTRESYADAEGTTCAMERDWADLLAVLLLSLPFAVVGTVLYTSGAADNRLSRHVAEVNRLTEFPGKS